MANSSPITIVAAQFPDDTETVRILFAEYIDSLGLDLTFQDVQTELAQIPGKYASPTGTILLARDEAGHPLGCVALRPFGEGGTCEIKRLYVRPEARGHQLGRRLASTIIAEAKNRGYAYAVLDTLASMHPARNLYTSLGFEEIEPYYHNPIPEAVYYGRDLLNLDNLCR